MWGMDERLAWLSKQYCTDGTQVTVVEQAEEGEAQVQFVSSERLICLNSPNNKPLYFLDMRKLADGIILQLGASRTALHIVECKKTIKENSWKTVKEQWAGAVQSAFALCGVLGVPAPANTDIFLYSAYREDKLSAAQNTNPALLKMPVGVTTAAHKPQALEWSQQQVKILERQFEHRKIQLDETGNGRFEIGDCH